MSDKKYENLQQKDKLRRDQEFLRKRQALLNEYTILFGTPSAIPLMVFEARLARLEHERIYGRRRVKTVADHPEAQGHFTW